MYKHNASIMLSVKFAGTQFCLLLLRKQTVFYVTLLLNRKHPVENIEGMLLSYFKPLIIVGFILKISLTASSR